MIRIKAYLLTDVHDFCTRLTSLKYHDCLNAIGEVLEVANVEKPWQDLQLLHLNNNTIPVMDVTMVSISISFFINPTALFTTSEGNRFIT